MDNSQYRFISVVYQLYSVVDGEKELEEQTSTERPFEFITGYGIALEGFERHVKNLEKGSMFDFTLQPEEAFGEYDPEGARKLDREFFTINGKFDHEHIFEGAVITLSDNEDHQFMAKVTKVESDGVTVDTNHPYAGKALNFMGLVRENRPATEEEIQHLIMQLTGSCGGCGQHGGDCEGGCGGCH